MTQKYVTSGTKNNGDSCRKITKVQNFYFRTSQSVGKARALFIAVETPPLLRHRSLPACNDTAAAADATASAAGHTILVLLVEAVGKPVQRSA